MIGYSYPDWGMDDFYRREDMLQIQEANEEKNFSDKKEAFINFAKEYALRFGYVFFHDEEDLLIEEISLEKVHMDISKIIPESLVGYEAEWKDVLWEFVYSKKDKDWEDALEYAIQYEAFPEINFVINEIKKAQSLSKSL